MLRRKKGIINEKLDVLGFAWLFYISYQAYNAMYRRQTCKVKLNIINIIFFHTLSKLTYDTLIQHSVSTHYIFFFFLLEEHTDSESGRHWKGDQLHMDMWFWYLENVTCSVILSCMYSSVYKRHKVSEQHGQVYLVGLYVNKNLIYFRRHFGKPQKKFFF